MKRDSCLITSGSFLQDEENDYIKKMSTSFNLVKSDNISVNISHGMTLDMENKLKSIYRYLYRPISTILASIINYKDSKYIKEIEDKKVVHKVFQWAPMY